jgi:hypothetical protein
LLRQTLRVDAHAFAACQIAHVQRHQHRPAQLQQL